MRTLLLLWLSAAATELPPLKPIARVLPPEGTPIAEADRAKLRSGVEALTARLEQARGNELLPDVEIYAKAVRYALDLGEFYQAKDVAKAAELLARGNQRLDQLLAAKPAWPTARGTLARGYRSTVDGSVQPYGLEIPADVALDRPAPLIVWLHGRGDTTTDLPFIAERERSPGKLQIPGALVVHPFGRQCLGYKSAGEIDVLDVIDEVKRRYRVDPDRVVLAGFSMGGAGSWHIGAHYTDRFVAVSPGAGFVETLRYLKIKTPGATFDPPSYERTLLATYDVPAYVRNLFNVPVISYSGEKDPQQQSAQVMAEAFAGEGRTLRQVIGPGTGHAYHPDSLAEIARFLGDVVKQGRTQPDRVMLQTRTLRYNRMHWVELLGLGKHWEDARVDGARQADGTVVLTTKNATALRLAAPMAKVTIDGQTPPPGPLLVKAGTRWKTMQDLPPGLAKRPGLQGPIDDAFLEPFLVVEPTGRSAHPLVERWVAFERQHLDERWRAVYRGELRRKADRAVTDADIRDHHLLLWGDPTSNAVLGRIAARLPVRWTAREVTIAGQRFDAGRHVPLLIFPNPLNPKRYVVINSGPTHREGHDHTNSLQNPKLPDWAVIDLQTPPDARLPGRVAAAGFFDERWSVSGGRR